MISTSDETLLGEVGVGAELGVVLSDSFSGDGSRSMGVEGAGGGAFTISDIGVLGVGFLRAGSESLLR